MADSCTLCASRIESLSSSDFDSYSDSESGTDSGTTTKRRSDVGVCVGVVVVVACLNRFLNAEVGGIAKICRRRCATIVSSWTGRWQTTYAKGPKDVCRQRAINKASGRPRTRPSVPRDFSENGSEPQCLFVGVCLCVLLSRCWPRSECT